jgi:hypothetical protein
MQLLVLTDDDVIRRRGKWEDNLWVVLRPFAGERRRAASRAVLRLLIIRVPWPLILVWQSLPHYLLKQIETKSALRAHRH